MFLKKQDLRRQGRSCPEAELGKVFKMGCEKQRATQESIPTAGRGIALVSKLLCRGWVGTRMSEHAHRTQKTALWSRFSPSVLEHALGIELQALSPS